MWWNHIIERLHHQHEHIVHRRSCSGRLVYLSCVWLPAQTFWAQTPISDNNPALILEQDAQLNLDSSWKCAACAACAKWLSSVWVTRESPCNGARFPAGQQQCCCLRCCCCCTCRDSVLESCCICKGYLFPSITLQHAWGHHPRWIHLSQDRVVEDGTTWALFGQCYLQGSHCIWVLWRTFCWETFVGIRG